MNLTWVYNDLQTNQAMRVAKPMRGGSDRPMFTWSPDMAEPKYDGSAARQTHTRLSSAND